MKRTVFLGFTAWVASITALHAWLNLDLFRRAESAEKTFKVGFLPVT